ncbi:MAG: hypothetical protein RIC95_07110 [Vicingaceae bacterium]
MDEDKLKTFLQKGSEISAGAVGGAIGLIGGPIGAIAGGTLGVLTGQILNEIIERKFSDRQKLRLAATTAFVFDGIASRINKGQTVRDDGFFDQAVFERSKAEELFEGTLIKCSTQYQEKKIKFISKIFEKAVFDKTISAESVNQLLEVSNSFSYRKLCLISLIGRRSIDYRDLVLMRDVYSWYPTINFSVNLKLLLQDLYELVNFGILKNQVLMVTNNEVIPDKLTLTEIGDSIFSVLDLVEIEKKDIDPIIEELKYREEWGVSTGNTINGEHLKK